MTFTIYVLVILLGISLFYNAWQFDGSRLKARRRREIEEEERRAKFRVTLSDKDKVAFDRLCVRGGTLVYSSEEKAT